ncbi:hypothetical protein ScPMuIL_018905 [Solemya velum]
MKKSEKEQDRNKKFWWMTPKNQKTEWISREMKREFLSFACLFDCLQRQEVNAIGLYGETDEESFPGFLIGTIRECFQLHGIDCCTQTRLYNSKRIGIQESEVLPVADYGHMYAEPAQVSQFSLGNQSMTSTNLLFAWT